MKTNNTSTDLTKQIDHSPNSGRKDECKHSSLASAISQQVIFSPQKSNDMSAKTAKPKVDICQVATERIIKLLEQGEVAWRRTWGTYGLARNFKTQHVYTGINMFFLNFLSPHSIPYYLTFKQAKEMGGTVKKGSKAEWVYFYKGYYKDADGKNISEADSKLSKYKDAALTPVRFLKSYPVFNIEDIEGIEWEQPAELTRPNNTIEECEALIQSMPEQVTFVQTDRDRAFYNPQKDVVNVPKIEQFENASFYYRTTFHEIGHWTGHATRLNRPGVVEQIDSSSDRYAEEELIAELTSNYLLNIANVQEEEVMEVSAGYLKSWIERLKKDPKFIFRVAPKAQAAAEYILGMKVAELPL